jgi:hypothetical protein
VSITITIGQFHVGLAWNIRAIPFFVEEKWTGDLVEVDWPLASRLDKFEQGH